MSRNNVRTWIVLSIGLSLGVAPFLVRGDQATRDRLEQNRQVIASMTQSERDRLDRNFEAYKLMDAQEISTLKAFHQKLNQQSSGEWTSVLDQYHAWLETIEPYQRDKLKETTDPQQRIALMNVIIGEQRARDAARFLKGAYRNIKDRRTLEWLSRIPHIPVLSESDLARLMGSLERSERDKFPLAKRTELGKKEGLYRYSYLLELIKTHTNVRSQDTERRGGPRVLPQFQQAFEKLARTFDTHVEDSKAREFMSQNRDEKTAPSMSLKIQGIILKSFIVHAFAQNVGLDIPAQAELESLFTALPEEAQDELLQLEAIDFYKELVALGGTTKETINPREVIRPFFSKEYSMRFQRGNRPSSSPGIQNDGVNGDGRGRPGFGRPGERRLDRDNKPRFRGDGIRRPNGQRPDPPPRPREEADKP